MTDEHTPGAEGAAITVANYLRDHLPEHLDAVARRAGVDALPSPVKVTHWDPGPLGVEEWPTVIVQAPRTRRVKFADVEVAAGMSHRVTYAVEVLAWVRAEGYEATSLAAMRYGTAIRQALLHRHQLTAWEDRDGGNPTAVLVPESITEDRSPVSEVGGRGGRTIAAVAVAFDVVRVELTPGPEPLGRVAAVDVGGVAVGPAQPLPAHPAFE